MQTVYSIEKDLEKRYKTAPEIVKGTTLSEPELAKCNDPRQWRRAIAVEFALKTLDWAISDAQEKNDSKLSTYLRANRNLSSGEKNLVETSLEELFKKHQITIGSTKVTAENYMQYIDRAHVQEQLRKAIKSNLDQISPSIDSYEPFVGVKARAKIAVGACVIDHAIGAAAGLSSSAAAAAAARQAATEEIATQTISKKVSEKVFNEELKRRGTSNISNLLVRDVEIKAAETAATNAGIKAAEECAKRAPGRFTATAIDKGAATLATKFSAKGLIWLAKPLLRFVPIIGQVYTVGELLWDVHKLFSPKYKTEDSMIGLVGIGIGKAFSGLFDVSNASKA